MALKPEQNDNADPGGFHEFASLKRPGPAADGKTSGLEPGSLPDIAAEEEGETDSDDENEDPATDPQP